MLPKSLLATAAVTASLAPSVLGAGQTITIPWDLSDDLTAEEVKAPAETITPYDAIKLDYTGNSHDVWMLKDRAAYVNCDFVGAYPVSARSGPATFVPKSGGTFYLASKIEDDCELGLKVALKVAPLSGGKGAAPVLGSSGLVLGSAPLGARPPVDMTAPDVGTDGVGMQDVPPIVGTQRDVYQPKTNYPYGGSMMANMWANGNWGGNPANWFNKGNRPSSTFVVDWYRPINAVPQLLEPGKALANDHIKFWFPGTMGDVYMIPSQEAWKNCDFSKASFLYNGPGPVYDYWVTQPGDYFFASRNNCRQGQKIQYIVSPLGPQPQPQPVVGTDARSVSVNRPTLTMVNPFATPSAPIVTMNNPSVTPVAPIVTMNNPFATPVTPTRTTPFLTMANPFATTTNTPVAPIVTMNNPLATPVAPIVTMNNPFATATPKPSTPLLTMINPFATTTNTPVAPTVTMANPFATATPKPSTTPLLTMANPFATPTPTPVVGGVKVPWQRPSTRIGSLKAVSDLQVNGTVTFDYVDVGADTANVVRLKTLDELKNCNLTNAIVMNGQSGPYRLLFQSYGSYFFTSSIGDHCRQGLRQIITVPRPNANSPATIRGVIYNDWNNNSAADAGEGIGNVPITLTQNGSTIATAKTDSAGIYTFTNLKQGQYEVSVGAIPDLDVPDTPAKRRVLTVLGGETGTFNFRVLGPAPDAKATIFGNIYNDLNKNGQYDSNEGILSAAVSVKSGTGATVATATTDSSGRYSFTVDPGNYKVVISALPGYNVPDLPVVKDIMAGAGAQVQYNYHIIAPPLDAKATLQGSVYNDKNSNGSPDSGEGIGSVPITVTNTQTGQIVATATTGTNGMYSVQVAPGTYRISIGDIPGFPIPATVNKSNVVTATPAGTVNYNYAVSGVPADTKGRVIGAVFWDQNDNGANDAGEGLSGISVTLLSATTNQQLATATTASNGGFSFPDLAPTQYKVLVGVIPGFNIAEAQRSRTVTVPAGSEARFDFRVTGQRGSLDPNGYINGTIYTDYNTNSAPDSGEGIENVEVTVYSVATNQVVQTARTAKDGSYRFTVTPGDYRVVIGAIPNVDATLADRTRLMTIVNGATVPFNFRVLGPRPDAPGTVVGTIFLDKDLNNQPSAGEGIAGVKVDVTTATGQIVNSSTTDASGKYSITVPPGQYKALIGTIPDVDVPISYRTRDVTVNPAGTASFTFRLTPPPGPAPAPAPSSPGAVPNTPSLTPITWTRPATPITALPEINIRVGDSVNFDYTTNHNVVLFPSQLAFQDCDWSNAPTLKAAGPYTHTFTKAGTYYFGCTTGDHCARGMKVKVNVA